LGEFRGRIEILNTLCWKFAAVCGKLQLLVHLNFLAHDAADGSSGNVATESAYDV